MKDSGQVLSEDADPRRWFGRHFVYLQFEVACPERVEPWSSGFGGTVIEHSGEWFLITAGHVISELRARMEAGYTYSKWKIIDGFSSTAIDTTPIPFDFADAMPGALDEWDLGYDYGTIHFKEFYRSLMRANNIVPLGEESWPTSRRGFDMFISLGVPYEHFKRGIPGVETHDKSWMLLLEPRSEDEVPSELVKENPRLYLHIERGFDEPDAPLGSLEGMSGGPLFGLAKVDGEDRYWYLGIQSGCDYGSRICTFSPVDGRLLRAIDLTVKSVRGEEF